MAASCPVAVGAALLHGPLLLPVAGNTVSEMRHHKRPPTGHNCMQHVLRQHIIGPKVHGRMCVLRPACRK